MKKEEEHADEKPRMVDESPKAEYSTNEMIKIEPATAPMDENNKDTVKEEMTRDDKILKKEGRSSTDPNYLVMVMMSLSTDPRITRFLSVPPSLTFADLHEVLQIAFGWTNSHIHTFSVDVEVKCDIGGGKEIMWPTQVLHLQVRPSPMDTWP